jgi:phage-related protein
LKKPANPLRSLRWVGSSKKDLTGFPAKVKDSFGFELYLAQAGQHPPSAKPFKGLGSGVVELVDNHDGDTYRAVYTVRLQTAVYVLHCFKKKSKQGTKTPQPDVDLIERRLKDAIADDAARMTKAKTK